MVLSPQQVLSVAAPFISGGCDPATALGLTREYRLMTAAVWRSWPERLIAATPALTVTNTDAVLPGTLVTFGGAGLDGQDTAVSISSSTAQSVVLRHSR